MSVSDTKPSMAQWAEVYSGAGTAGQAMVSGGRALNLVDSTVVTTTSPGSPASQGSAMGRGGAAAGKSARRRSRASRRAPVTLLNTDTTNFRAMVQQFTGIPSGQYPPAGSVPGAGPVISLGPDFNPQLRPGTSPMVSFEHLQPHPYPSQSYQQQLYHQQQQHFHRTAFALGSGYSTGGGGGGGGGGDGFVQGYGNEGVFYDSVQGQMMPRAASTNTRADGYFARGTSQGHGNY